MDTPTQHLSLQAALKLNPKLYAWFWEKTLRNWFRTTDPNWFPKRTYALTDTDAPPTWTPIPHLALQAAYKLNPNLQCWIWNGHFSRARWVPVGRPKWVPHRVYTVTNNRSEKPKSPT